MIKDPNSNNIEKKATRDGYGDGLLQLGKIDPKLVVLDADLSGSTKTKTFALEFPERFFNFGVAEQNLVGHAAGMAIGGLHPVASSFAMFLAGRAWEIVRNSVGYPQLKVVLAASHAGISLGEDGASHQIIEDIALMRSIPGMTVIVPADYYEAYHAILSTKNLNSPCYIRLGRPSVPMIYDKDYKFEISKASVIKKDGDIAFLATGIMVYEAWKAAIELEKIWNRKIKVINFSTIKPLDTLLLDELIKEVSTFYTFEEHNIIGGFGSAISEYISEKKPTQVIKVGIKDEFGQSGSVKDLMDHYELTSDKLILKLKDTPPA